MKPPGFPGRVPMTSLCPTVRSARSWFSSCPPVLAPTSRSCSFPFPLAVLGRKMLLTPGHQGCWGLQHRKPPTPKGGTWSWGKWSWWGRVGREIQQLLELWKLLWASTPGKPQGCSQLGFMWRRLDGMCCTVNEGIWDGALHVMGTQKPHKLQRCLLGREQVWAWWQAWGQPVVPPSNQHRTPVLVSAMRNLTPKHSCTQRGCMELGNKPLLWTSAIKTSQWDFLQTFSAFQQKHKTQWKSDKIFWTKIQIQTSGFGVIFMA